MKTPFLSTITVETNEDTLWKEIREQLSEFRHWKPEMTSRSTDFHFGDNVVDRTTLEIRSFYTRFFCPLGIL
jgi:hypothetical protein